MHLGIGPMDNAKKKTLNPEAQHTINLKPKAYSPTQHPNITSTRRG